MSRAIEGYFVPREGVYYKSDSPCEDREDNPDEDDEDCGARFVEQDFLMDEVSWNSAYIDIFSAEPTDELKDDPCAAIESQNPENGEWHALTDVIDMSISNCTWGELKTVEGEYDGIYIHV